MVKVNEQQLTHTGTSLIGLQLYYPIHFVLSLFSSSSDSSDEIRCCLRKNVLYKFSQALHHTLQHSPPVTPHLIPSPLQALHFLNGRLMTTRRSNVSDVTCVHACCVR